VNTLDSIEKWTSSCVKIAHGVPVSGNRECHETYAELGKAQQNTVANYSANPTALLMRHVAVSLP
jgi:hypothetical protein